MDDGTSGNLYDSNLLGGSNSSNRVHGGSDKFLDNNRYMNTCFAPFIFILNNPPISFVADKVDALIWYFYDIIFLAIN